MSPTEPSRGARHILVVEDEATSAEALGLTLLGVADTQVSFASGAEEALALLARRSFHLLITDIHLPSMDGLELLAAVRGHPRFAHLPVVIISGDSDPRTPERALSLGASAFIRKPYSPSAVRRLVEELLHAQ